MTDSGGFFAGPAPNASIGSAVPLYKALAAAPTAAAPRGMAPRSPSLEFMPEEKESFKKHHHATNPPTQSESAAASVPAARKRAGRHRRGSFLTELSLLEI